MEGNKQLFKQFDRFNGNSFYNFLKQVHHKFPKCYLFLDKTPQHYKSHKIKQYLQKHKQDLIPIWLPTALSEFIILEERWNMYEKDLLILTCYRSFTDFRKEISQYFRTMHFNMSMQNYLVRCVSIFMLTGIDMHVKKSSIDSYIQRLTTVETQQYVKGKLGLDMNLDYLSHVKENLRKDSKKHLKSYQSDRYAFLNESNIDASEIDHRKLTRDTYLRRQKIDPLLVVGEGSNSIPENSLDSPAKEITKKHKPT